MIDLPDARGRYGDFGGRCVPETLMTAHEELERAYVEARADPSFQAELAALLRDFAGRPTPLYLAANLTRELGGATATICAQLGIECIVYMGEVDMERQAPNVFRMRLLGAEVRPVGGGSRTLQDAINEAMRDWVTNVATTYYLIGSVVGAHPYPMIVRDFQSVIGREARAQLLEREGRLPDYAVACVGGGSNAIGLFNDFLDDASVRLIGVEAAGHGIASGEHAASLGAGRPGVLHGSYSYLLQDAAGQVLEAHSISAGLDYPGVGPEHAYLKASERAHYESITDAEALAAFQRLCLTEGIIPALESAHAIAYVEKLAPKLRRDEIILVCLSGRGDKDLETVAKALARRHWAAAGRVEKLVHR